MTTYDRPILTCTICGKEVADTITAIVSPDRGYARNNQYCKGHKNNSPVNRAERRMSRQHRLVVDKI